MGNEFPEQNQGELIQFFTLIIKGLDCQHYSGNKK